MTSDVDYDPDDVGVRYRGSMPGNAKRGKGKPKQPTPHEVGLDPRIPIVEVDYTIPPLGTRKAQRKKFSDVRKDFLIGLAAERADDLRAVGLTETEITAMRDHGRGPQGWNVHHKLPIHGGGQNVADNLILIRLDAHKAIHDYLDPQVLAMDTGQSKRVRLPRPVGPLWIPPGVTLAPRQAVEFRARPTAAPRP